MSTPDAAPRGSRETRLLLVTIAVSVAVLLLLARFRFPEEGAPQTVSSAPAPLERLAARATYDELASTMADLERRIVPRLALFRAQDASGAESLVVATRLTPDRAVALVDPEARLNAMSGPAPVDIVGRDEARSLVVLRVPAVDDGAVAIRQGTPRAGPRYVAVVEASPAGPIVRPLYAARVETSADAAGRPTLLFSGLQQPLPMGSAVFTLEGALLGLVLEPGLSAVVVPAETLPAAILNAQPAEARKPSSLGIDVNALTPSLARATGADHGVVVARVHPASPAAEALRSGDVIQTIDGSRVTSVAGFRRIERTRPSAASVAVSGVRLGKPLAVTLTAEPAEEPPAASDPADLAFVGRTVAGTGIEVVAVQPAGAAAAAGLSRGDLIIAIDGEPARDLAALARRFRSAAAGTAILLTVQRGQQHRVLALEKR
jgi:S1-C subfamily serine protease